jgi:prepilin-type processing-associated H-X9-DG protein
VLNTAGYILMADGHVNSSGEKYIEDNLKFCGHWKCY